MPTIAHVKWEKMNLDYGWLFKLSNLFELLTYWKEIKDTQFSNGLSDYIHCRECGTHPASTFGQLFQELMQINENKTAYEVIGKFADDFLMAMANAIKENGSIYVNENGGYFFLIDGMEEVEVRQIEKWIIPGEEIRIKQWPNGKHFYAYVGSVSVVYNDRNKWDSEEEAKYYAEKWIKNNK